MPNKLITVLAKLIGNGAYHQRHAQRCDMILGGDPCTCPVNRNKPKSLSVLLELVEDRWCKATHDDCSIILWHDGKGWVCEYEKGGMFVAFGSNKNKDLAKADAAVEALSFVLSIKGKSPSSRRR